MTIIPLTPDSKESLFRQLHACTNGDEKGALAVLKEMIKRDPRLKEALWEWIARDLVTDHEFRRSARQNAPARFRDVFDDIDRAINEEGAA